MVRLGTRIHDFAGRLPTACALGAAMVLLAAPVSAQESDLIEHRIRQGETPYSLAREYLASLDDHRAVIRINRIADAHQIPVGTVIRLPRNRLSYRPADLRIEAFSGQVTIAGEPAARGMAVPEGAVIRTGGNGFLSLRGSGGTVLTLPTNTHAQLVRARIYRLDDLKDIEFRILSGRGEAQVPGLRPRERYKISTPASVSAVRGTVFRVGYLEGEQRAVVEVVEGAVATAAGADEVVASTGFGIAASAAGLSPPEALQPPPAMIAPGAVQTQERVRFRFGDGETTGAIRTQIARDAGFVDVLAEQIAPREQGASFGDIADGRYFVRARAITPAGIEGTSEVYSFRRKRLGTSASAEPASLSNGFRFAWLPDGEGETTYAFQLWNAASPAQRIIDETAMRQQSIVVTDLAPGTYEWRVAAIQVDEEGLLQVWGPVQRLQVSE